MDIGLADRAHENLMTISSWTGETPGAASRQDDGELLFASRSPFALLNGAMRRRSTEGAEPLLDRARRFFSERDRSFVAYAWPGDPEVERAAVRTGMRRVVERYPEMVCRATLPPLPGDLRAVQAPTDAESYWAICDAAYPSIGFPGGLFSEAFEASELLDAGRVWACLAYDEDQPVACASAWMAGDVGMVGWVASLPQARGLGLAAACTVRVTNHLLRQGFDLVSLQASPMGESIYRRLGYQELFSYSLYGVAPQ
jgi:ribosomal protein S18 acetylase RimI-like enzyme